MVQKLLLATILLFATSAFAETYPEIEGKLTIETPDVYLEQGMSLRVIVTDSCHYGECNGKPSLAHEFVVPVGKDGSYKLPAFELNQPRGAITVTLFEKLSSIPRNIPGNNVEFQGPKQYVQFASGFTIEKVNPTMTFDFNNMGTIDAIKTLFAKEGVDVSQFGNPRFTIDVEGYFTWEIKSRQCCHLLRYTTPIYSIYRTSAEYNPEIKFSGLYQIMYPTYFKKFERNNSLNLTSAYARVYEWYAPRVQRALKSAEVSLISDNIAIINLGSKATYKLPVKP